jgi:hypothetical protein
MAWRSASTEWPVRPKSALPGLASLADLRTIAFSMATPSW